MYSILEPWFDLEDGNTQYAPKGKKSPYAKKGERVHRSYPRPGLEPSEERVQELSGHSNKRGKPLIGGVEDGSA